MLQLLNRELLEERRLSTAAVIVGYRHHVRTATAGSLECCVKRSGSQLDSKARPC
jgi:hypothetical protein